MFVAFAAAFALLLGLTPAYGQQDGRLPHTGLTPVDQAVADLDPLAQSQRVMRAGLRADGEQTSLFALPLRPSETHTTDRRYLRLGPGFQAEVPRGNYLVPIDPLANPFGNDVAINVAPAQDGRFVELIPAGTVFHLAPIDTRLSAAEPTLGESPAGHSPGGHAPTATPDARLDFRVDLRITDRVGGGPINTRIQATRVDASAADSTNK